MKHGDMILMAPSTAAKLKDRVALVTGAGRGIGRAIALLYAKEGAAIGAVARSKDELCSLVQEIQSIGGRAAAISADLSTKAQTCEVVSRCVEIFGGIDILVNNAGVGSADSPKPLIDFEDDFWDLTIALNLTAPYLLMKAVLPKMIERRNGRIINVASLAGKTGMIHGSAYAASKHGLVGITRAAALEVAQMGITINAICPGPVRSRMNDIRAKHDAERLGVSVSELQWTPLGRRLEPEEIAGTALFLASDEASVITGQAFNVCGGVHMS